MTRPHFEEIADIPLVSDEAVLHRVRELVEGASRQQLWLMFLDARGCQLPVVIPHEIPRRPGREAVSGFRSFLGELVDDLDAAAVVLVLEREGPDELGAGDRAWFALVADACQAAELPLRGPVLCSEDGFRWIAPEDYLVGAG